MIRHTFYGPNGIEVNEREFARLLSVGGNKTPLVIRAKKKAKRRKAKKKKVWKRKRRAKK